jgi:hypothetical protein
MPAASPWSLSIWTHERASLVTTTPITRLKAVHTDYKTNAPYQFSFECHLSDYVLAGIDRGHYFELSRARSGAKALWCNGYIVNVDKSTTQPMTCTISAVSPSWYFSEFRTLPFWAGPGLNYTSVIDYLQGLTPPTSTGVNQQGLLPPGWTVNWVDGINGTNGTTVGTGDIWHASLDTTTADLTDVVQHYNILWRESTSQTNYAYSGKIDIGPLGDASGLTIWGGAPLLADLQTNHGYPASRKAADLRTAQKFGYAVITSASYQSDYSNLRNICWILGAGHWDANLQNLAGGPPLDANGHLQNTWTAFTPTSGYAFARPYYTKVATNYATYDGHVYSWIASQATTGEWMYGVVDTTSVNTYGACEYTLVERKIKDPNLLMSAALGCVAYWGQPVNSFTFKVAQPLTSASANPQRVMPGQQVTVHYSGQVPAVEIWPANSGSHTGQWDLASNVSPTLPSNYHYIDYPDSADSQAVAKLSRCIEFQEDWANGQLIQTITLGQSRTKWKSFADNLARQMLKNRHAKIRNNSFTKYSGFEGVPWWCSNSPTAWEDQSTRQLNFNPGGTAIADVAQGKHVFSDYHDWRFTVTANDGTNYLDCWFAKPTDNGTTFSPNPTADGTTRVYACLRLAFTASPNSNTNSATSTGFYWTNDGATWNSVGVTHKSPLLDASQRLSIGESYDVIVSWRGRSITARISGTDGDASDIAQTHHPLCEWTDTNATGSNPVLDPNNMGTIGYKLHNGSSANAFYVTKVHAGPHIPATIHRSAHHPHTPSKHQWHNLVGEVTNYNSSTGKATVVMHPTPIINSISAVGATGSQTVTFTFPVPMASLLSCTNTPITIDVGANAETVTPGNANFTSSGTNITGFTATFAKTHAAGAKAAWQQAYLANDNGDVLWNADLSNISWDIDQTISNANPADHIVWNGETYSISDGTTNVGTKSWGALKLTKSGKHSWNNVYIWGKLTDCIDEHTQKPWTQGHHPGAHKKAGSGIAKRAVGRKHHHPHHPHKKHRRKSSSPGATGTHAWLRITP